MIKNILSTLTFAAFGLSCLGGNQLYGQAAAQGASNARNDEPLQMIVTYGDGKEKRRESHYGIVEPVGFPVGQPVGITLQFLRKRAGEAVEIISRDGGHVDLQAPAAISGDGSLSFTFQPGGIPGLYRLTVNGPQQYEISLYGVDPNQPAQRRGN